MRQVRGTLGIRLLVLTVVVQLVGGACGPPAAAPPAAPTAAKAEPAAAAPATKATAPAPAAPAPVAPKPGGRVIVGAFADAKVLSPITSTDAPSAEVWNRIYESLIKVDPKTAQPVPRLAERWEVSPDSKTLTFVLRDGLTWSDGSPLTGEDFKFTAEAVMRSKTTVRKNIFQDIVGAKDYGEGKLESITGIAVSGNTLTINMDKPFCPALTDLGLFGIVPKSVFGKYLDPKDASKNLDNAPENTAPTLASGVFKFKEWKPNDSITLVRNERFFGGPALLDEWVYKVYPDVNALAAALKTGEIDLSHRVEPKDKDDLQRLGTLDLFSVLAPGYVYMGWNQLRGGKEFFQSKAVRQALAYGVNMDLVIERVLFGEGKRMVAHTPPVSWAYDPAALNQYAYDPKKAQELLESDGWSKGADGVYQKGDQRLEFTMITNSGNKIRETLLQVAVEQYKQIGVNVTPQTESFEALVDRLNKSRDPKYGEQGGRDVDAYILGWSLGVDPDAFNIWHSRQNQGGFNYVSYKNEAADQALEAGRTRCAQADRTAAYRAFDKQLNEDQPYNFGFAQNSLIFASKRIQGLDPGPFPNYYNGTFWNLEKWAVK